MPRSRDAKNMYEFSSIFTIGPNHFQGDKMIETLKEQEKKMIQIHVEQKNALERLMKKDEEDYRRRMGELDGKLKIIEEKHGEAMKEIESGRVRFYVD